MFWHSGIPAPKTAEGQVQALFRLLEETFSATGQAIDDADEENKVLRVYRGSSNTMSMCIL